MSYQIVLEKSGIVMLMEDSELRASAGDLLDQVVPLKRRKAYLQSPRDHKDEIVSLLDKCKDFSVNSQKWSKPPKTQIANGSQDRLKQAIDVTMERLETWSPKSWANLVKEIRYEMKVAYDKFINIRKKYSGLIDISQGDEAGELIKADIARDIQEYVKYGINLSLQFCSEHIPICWIWKVGIHFEMLARELERLNVRNEDELRRLAEDVSLYKQCMVDFADNWVGSLDESGSKAFMMLRHKGGIPFSDMLERKKNELGFAHHPFTYLLYLERNEVYQGIINELDGENTSKLEFVDFLFG